MSVRIKFFVCVVSDLKRCVPDEKHIYSLHQIESQHEYWLIDLLGFKKVPQQAEKTTQPNKVKTAFYQVS